MILKLFKNIFTCFEILLLGFILQSCASFPDVPKNVKPSSEIVGIYSNDCDSAWGSSRLVKLWRLVDKDSKFTFKEEDSTLVLGSTPDNRPTIDYVKIKEDSFFVRFEITQENQLKAQLIKTNEVLAEKIINGEFEEDQSYYTPRDFYILPFFPLFYGFNNEKERIYHVDNYLVFENTRNSGLVILIASAGGSEKQKWLFRKIR